MPKTYPRCRTAYRVARSINLDVADNNLLAKHQRAGNDVATLFRRINTARLGRAARAAASS